MSLETSGAGVKMQTRYWRRVSCRSAGQARKFNGLQRYWPDQPVADLYPENANLTIQRLFTNESSIRWALISLRFRLPYGDYSGMSDASTTRISSPHRPNATPIAIQTDGNELEVDNPVHS